MDIEDEVEYLGCVDELIEAAQAVLDAEPLGLVSRLSALKRLEEALKFAKEADEVLKEKARGRV